MAEPLNEIQPYMFEPVFDPDESGSNDGEGSNSESDTEEGLVGRAGQPGHMWCQCTKCSAMPRDRDCVCCMEWDDILENKLDDRTCIVDHPDFPQVCLDPVPLCMAYINFMAYKKIPGHVPEQLTNRQSRLMAYRQFCLWAHQGVRLGKHKRKVEPSCVVNAIRERYPQEDNNYTGYMEADEVQNALDSDSD